MICVVNNESFNVTLVVQCTKKGRTISKRRIIQLLFGFCSRKNITTIFNYNIIVRCMTKKGK